MLRHSLDTGTGIIEIEIDGPTELASYKALIRDLEAEIAAQGKLVILQIVRDLGWISPAVWIEDLSWSLRHMKAFSKVALVTDKLWLAAVARSATLFMPMKLRTFALSEQDEARRWLLA